MAETRSDRLFGYLGLPGEEIPQIKQILGLHSATVLVLGLLLLGCGLSHLFIPYAVGALLVSFNLLVLARLLPQLVFEQTGAVFALLVSFYLRLAFTGGVLFAAIYIVQLNALGLLLGLSTILASFIAWGGMVLVSRKQKEA
ncbi:MAG: ATP synthase subunit I [Desulfohalobiaceae bacterium]